MNRKIRVCHVQLFTLLSGVQRSMLEIFRHLDRDRYDLHVVCKEPGPLTVALDDLAIPVHFAPSLDRSPHPWRDWRALRELHAIFARERFDIVHTHSSKPGILGRIAARSAGIPHVIHHVRGFPFHEYSPRWSGWFYRQLERRAARLCDCLMFVNQEECELAVTANWLPSEKCLTIFNGADLQQFHPRHRLRLRGRLRKTWGVAEGDFVILFVGRLEYPKQPLLVADIALQLETLRPDADWRICIAGSGPDELKLAEAVRSLQLEHRVKLLGWQSSAEEALHAADAVLLPSLYEGLPRALIEAQAAGLPIVASAARGNREVVTPQTGFLCPPKDANAFACALARLIDDPILCRAMGLAARRRAEACFDTAVTNRQIAQAYETLLAA